MKSLSNINSDLDRAAIGCSGVQPENSEGAERGKLMPQYGWMHDMMGGWGMGFGPVGWIFLLILIFFLLFAVFKVWGGGGPTRNQGTTQYGDSVNRETPLDILKMRYARGDISKDEFENLKKDLSS